MYLKRLALVYLVFMLGDLSCLKCVGGKNGERYGGCYYHVYYVMFACATGPLVSDLLSKSTQIVFATVAGRFLLPRCPLQHILKVTVFEVAGFPA